MKFITFYISTYIFQRTHSNTSTITSILCYLVSSSGNLMFSEGRTFMKRQHALKTTYKSLKTHKNNTICMTEDHLIYARKDSNNSFNQM